MNEIDSALAARGGDPAKPGDNTRGAFDVEAVRADFPILHKEVYGKPLAYLDNAASSQKPRQVLEAMTEAYEGYYANIHRGVHWLSQTCTTHFETARERLAGFINAARPEEIVFTRNGSEAVNLVAQSYGHRFLKAGQEIVLTTMEHHSNIVPWQLLRDQIGVELKVAPIDDDGNLRAEDVIELIGPNTGMVAITHISNAIGTVVPVKEIARAAREKGVPVLVDGCQALPHMKVDVQDIDADFYVITGHKMYGPSGIGALYGRYDLLKAMPPYQGGGEMISRVTFERSDWKNPPHKFEAGTPAIVDVIGLGAAVDYLESIGMDNIAAHEAGLLAYASERLSGIEGLRIIGRAAEKAAILSFTMEQAHAHDIGTIVDRAGVALRAGHHCAQPTMDRFGLSATARASFGLYDTQAEVDQLVDALQTVQEIFG